MPRINKAFVETISEEGMYSDDDLRGFCLRVRSNSKVFIVRAKQRGTRKSVLVTIGPYPAFSAELARSQARILLNQLASGINPNQERKDRISAQEMDKLEDKQEEELLKLTLARVFADYLDSRKLKANTEYVYKCVINSTMRDWLEAPLTNITKEMVERRHKAISDKGHKGHADHAMRILRALFTYAMITYEKLDGEPVFISNPVRRLSQARIWNKLARRQSVIKSHELGPWYKAVSELSNPSARDYLLFLLFTGLRKNEAAQLKWENTDMKGKTILIPDPKNREPHMLPLTDFLYTMLRHRWQCRTNEYVFPGNGGKHAYLYDVRPFVEQVTRVSGVKFMLHDLRRTFLTIADAQDISAYAIKRLVNHKTQNDVTAGYIIADVERLRDPMNKICRFILEKTCSDAPSPSKKAKAIQAMSASG
jgi:integrase